MAEEALGTAIFSTGLDDEVDACTTDFTGKTDASGNLTIGTSIYNNGPKAIQVVGDGTTTTAYAYKTLSAIDDVYARIYLYLSSNFGLDNWEGITPIAFYNSATDLMRVQIIEDNTGKWKWKSDVRYSGGDSTIYNSAYGVVALETWYRIEIRYVKNDTAGGGQIWIDGSSMGSNFTLNTSAYSVNSLHVGLDSRYAADLDSGAYVYIDDIRVDDEAIGAYVAPPTATFTPRAILL